jgi:hypothetical protein
LYAWRETVANVTTIVASSQVISLKLLLILSNLLIDPHVPERRWFVVRQRRNEVIIAGAGFVFENANISLDRGDYGRIDSNGWFICPNIRGVDGRGRRCSL